MVRLDDHNSLGAQHLQCITARAATGPRSHLARRLNTRWVITEHEKNCDFQQMCVNFSEKVQDAHTRKYECVSTCVVN